MPGLQAIDTAGLQETVRFAVGLDKGHLTFLTRFGVTVLHAEDAFITLCVYMFENILVVHFSGGGFFSTGIVTYLQVTDLIPRLIEVIDNIAFVPLHMVHVEQELATGAANRLADHIGLVGMTEEEIGVVA